MAKKKAVEQKKDQNEDPTPRTDLPNTFQMFAKKKDTAFIAMTQEASMKADEDAANRRAKMPSRISSCIHKIRDTE